MYLVPDPPQTSSFALSVSMMTLRRRGREVSVYSCLLHLGGRSSTQRRASKGQGDQKRPQTKFCSYATSTSVDVEDMGDRHATRLSPFCDTCPHRTRRRPRTVPCLNTFRNIMKQTAHSPKRRSDGSAGLFLCDLVWIRSPLLRQISMRQITTYQHYFLEW